MFSATQNGIQLRMFSVMIRDHMTRNKLLTEKIKKEQPELYKHIIEIYDVPENEDISFFSGPPKEYPVIGYVGKASMRLEASRIQQPGQPPGQQAIYGETDFLMLPDNLGYMRLVLMMDCAISHYEIPINVRTFDYPKDAIRAEDSSVKIVTPKPKTGEKKTDAVNTVQNT